MATPAAVLALGRAAGNAAVSSVLAVQRNGPQPAGGASTPPVPSGLDAGNATQLALRGIELDADELRTLLAGFPNGFLLQDKPSVVLTMSSGSGLAMARVSALQVLAPSPLTVATEAYIFHVGKGRAVLLSSIGGGSVMLDAGSGTSLSGTSAGVRRLLAGVGAITVGPAAVPTAIRISHSDADHFNAVRALLSTAGFSTTAVEVATEQLRATGPFSRANLTVTPGQRLVEIDVLSSSGSVHVRRTVLDNMELTEFRSVPAHQAAAGGATRYDRNRTSPVTVVTDLVTGERSVYTADARGQQFTEIIDQIGERGFRRLLGAGGRNLRMVELPHHGGAQSGPDAGGLLRMLQLAFESSDGSLRVITQTSASFAAKPSSSIRFLDQAGVAPERIGATGSAPGATRAQGSTLATVTIDAGAVQRVLEVARAQETVLQGTYARLAQLGALRAEAGSLAEGLARAQAPAPLLSSVQATHAELVQQEKALNSVAQGTWTAMRQAASGSAGMRGSRDMTGVTTAFGTLAGHLNTVTPERFRADLEVHQSGLSAYARLYVNVVAMVAALETERFQDLHRLKAEHRQLLRAVRGVLGTQVVSEHVRGAWQATRSHWTSERIEALSETLTRRAIRRTTSTEFRAVLGESLARQMQLNELAQRAMHGSGRQVYGPGGSVLTPRSTRIGAGLLALVEVVRIGLEVAKSAQESAEAAAVEEVRQSWEGVSTLNWWLRRGVRPNTALVKRGWFSGRFDVVSGGMSQDEVLKAARSETAQAGVPEFNKVVVTGIDEGELRRMVMALVVTLDTLQDWQDLNRSYPTGEAFKRYDEGWAVRLWSAEDKDYRYFLHSDVTTHLDQLMSHLETGQQDLLEREVAAAGPGSVRAVKDTAIFGTDREMYIYGSGGAWKEIDVEDFVPKVLRLGRKTAPKSGTRSVFELVQAADLQTYKLLSRYWWVTDTGRQYLDRHGGGTYFTLAPNTQGMAYVDPDDLITTGATQALETAAAAKNPGLRPATR